MTRPIRVGAVSYLNARPLYYGLAAAAPEVRITMAVPSELARQLADDRLDIALIPSVEYLRGAHSRGYRILPGFAIAARQGVRSVKLYSRVPLDHIRRLALDEGSRTSQALTRIWLDGVHGIRPPQIEPLPLGMPMEESTADAVLLIGDRAMRPVPTGSQFAHVIDMGAAWVEWTGLPFVFALWVVRRGASLGELPEILHRCRTDGLASARAIADDGAARLGLDPQECYEYLTSVLSYDLGQAEQAGLRRFARAAAALDLAPEGVELVFHDDADHPDHDPAPDRRDPAVRR